MITWTNVTITSEYRDEQEKQIAAVLAQAGVDRSEVSAVIGGGEAGDRRLGFDATSKAAGQLAAAGFTGYEAGQA